MCRQVGPRSWKCLSGIKSWGKKGLLKCIGCDFWSKPGVWVVDQVEQKGWVSCGRGMLLGELVGRVLAES